MNKVLILSFDSILKWKSLDTKIKNCTKALNKAKNSKFQIDVVELSITQYKPEVVNGRITHKFMDKLVAPYFSTGYDFVALHMSKAQWEKLGLRTSLSGSYHVDKDDVEEMYFWSDENTRLTQHHRKDKFTQTFLHEMSHAYCRGAQKPDVTHQYHAKGDISGIFSSYDMALFRPERVRMRKTISLLEQVKALLQQLVPTRKLQPLVERQAIKIVDDMYSLGLPVRIVEGYRSPERQQELYNQGRTTPGQIVTNAKPGESLHNYGVAVDFVFRNQGYNATKEQWDTLGTVGKRHGFEWGGDWTEFVDRPHFEMRQGYSLKHFQQNKVDYNLYK